MNESRIRYRNLPSENAEKRAFGSGAQRRSGIFLLVLLTLFFWISVEYAHLLYRRYQIDAKKQWFVEENSRMTSQNRELERQYEYYKTDYFFRKEAKRKLNKKDPGEHVIIVTERGGVKANSIVEVEEDVSSKWWKLLFE
jgi:cell division protein FtsB